MNQVLLCNWQAFSLEKEKSEFEKKVLESKIQIYEELIKTIHS